MLIKVQNLIYYRQYLLRDLITTLIYAEGLAISHLKRNFDELYPVLEAYNETFLIFLLKFLATLAYSIDYVEASEASPVRTLTYYPEE